MPGIISAVLPFYPIKALYDAALPSPRTPRANHWSPSGRVARAPSGEGFANQTPLRAFSRRQAHKREANAPGSGQWPAAGAAGAPTGLRTKKPAAMANRDTIAPARNAVLTPDAVADTSVAPSFN
ncbi:MAG: hypothetical protein JWP75_3965 [Frondihabitans sp.]|nr:hypothetical protein [Frondihabitans sp.]